MGPWIVRLLSLGMVVSALAACAHGPIAGHLTRPGQPPAPAVLTYRSSFFGGSGKLSATLPTGEHFTGTYQLAPRDPKRQMRASLKGDRGSTMLCDFTLNEPGVGPDGGGTVHCQLSSGGAFDAAF